MVSGLSAARAGRRGGGGSPLADGEVEGPAGLVRVTVRVPVVGMSVVMPMRMAIVVMGMTMGVVVSVIVMGRHQGAVSHGGCADVRIRRVDITLLVQHPGFTPQWRSTHDIDSERQGHPVPPVA